MGRLEFGELHRMIGEHRVETVDGARHGVLRSQPGRQIAVRPQRIEAGSPRLHRARHPSHGCSSAHRSSSHSAVRTSVARPRPSAPPRGAPRASGASRCSGRRTPHRPRLPRARRPPRRPRSVAVIAAIHAARPSSGPRMIGSSRTVAARSSGTWTRLLSLLTAPIRACGASRAGSDGPCSRLSRRGASPSPSSATVTTATAGPAQNSRTATRQRSSVKPAAWWSQIRSTSDCVSCTRETCTGENPASRRQASPTPRRPAARQAGVNMATATCRATACALSAATPASRSRPSRASGSRTGSAAIYPAGPAASAAGLGLRPEADRPWARRVARWWAVRRAATVAT